MRKLLVLSIAVLSSLSFAQTTNSEAPRRVTELTFDGDTIEGTLARPDVEFIGPHGGKNFKRSLIRVREDFKDKVMESVLEL